MLKADLLFITDIYPGREKAIDGVTSKILVDECIRIGHSNVNYVENIGVIPKLIKTTICKNDMIITMGAGNIWRLCEVIKKELMNE